MGLCTLTDLKNNIYYLNNKPKILEYNLLYLSFILIKICYKLFKINIYHSDYKESNLIITSKLHSCFDNLLYLKIIDFGCSTTKFNKIYGLTNGYYSKFLKEVLENSNNNLIRLQYELHMIGNVIKNVYEKVKNYH